MKQSTNSADLCLLYPMSMGPLSYTGAPLFSRCTESAPCNPPHYGSHIHVTCSLQHCRTGFHHFLTNHCQQHLLVHPGPHVGNHSDHSLESAPPRSPNLRPTDTHSCPSGPHTCNTQPQLPNSSDLTRSYPMSMLHMSMRHTHFAPPLHKLPPSLNMPLSSPQPRYT